MLTTFTMNHNILLIFPVVFLCFFAWKWYSRIASKALLSSTQIPYPHSGISEQIINNARACIDGFDKWLSSNSLLVGLDWEWQSNNIPGQCRPIYRGESPDTTSQDMVAVLMPFGALLSYIPSKMGLMFVQRNWAFIPPESDGSIIQMKFSPNTISIEHDNLFQYVRGLTMTAVCCAVCGYQPDDDCRDGEGENNRYLTQKRLIWHSLIPSKFLVFPNYNPYQLLLCTSCEVEACRVRREFLRTKQEGIGGIVCMETWRHNFMEKMKPKFINMQQETFEIEVDRNCPEEDEE